MSFNWLVFPTFAFLFIAFWAGKQTFSRASSPQAKVGAVVLGGFLAIPSVLASAYYLHIFPEYAWYYQFRSVPGSELATAGAGFLVGCLTSFIPGKRLYTGTGLLTLLCVWTSIPYLKPIVAPLPASILKSTWRQDVCIQSSGSTCGPASAATILKTFGVDVTESQLAQECFSYLGGTENWYLARAFLKRGLAVKYRIETKFPNDLRPPAIAGVNTGCGHFIPILAETATTYITGDPIVGRKEYLKSELAQQYQFTGFYMEIRRHH